MKPSRATILSSLDLVFVVVVVALIRAPRGS
jgi:hypothetical protein